MKSSLNNTRYNRQRPNRYRSSGIQVVSRRRRSRFLTALIPYVVAVGFILCLVFLAVGAILSPRSALQPVPSPNVLAVTATDVPVSTPGTADPLSFVTPTLMGITPSPIPTVQPQGTIYTIQSGDTLWYISTEFRIPLEIIIAANPGLDPNVLYPGDTLIIPQPVAASTGSPQVFGFVSTVGEALRLRGTPEVADDNVITMLEPATALQIVGRTADYTWLQVTTPSGDQGWVMSEWVYVPSSLNDVPVVDAGGSPVATTIPSFATATPGGALPTLSPGSQSVDYPYISGITENARQIFMTGQSLGNRAHVFSKVGDSITASPVFLTPIGEGDYNLHSYAYLQPVIDTYSQEIARDANSFANTSLAAHGGWSVWHEFDPDSADPQVCLPGEGPLVCEYRVVRPSLALIMLGTNDVLTMSPDAYERYMRQVIETSISMGVVPVVSTLPDFYYEDVGNKVMVMNQIIVSLTQEYQVPLWDYWSVLQGLPNHGMSVDGIHPSWAVPADFSPSFLRYGMTTRNLTALQALDAVWRLVIMQ